jgi:hypothetical protein
VDWYVGHDRVRIAPTWSEAMSRMVDGWYDDVGTGVNSAMLAWRRVNVA